MAHNINLRGLDKSLMARLKAESKQRGVSMNTLILQFIRQGLGLTYERKATVYHDLDKLAGTWSKKDEEEFNKAIVDFEKIDPELWS